MLRISEFLVTAAVWLSCSCAKEMTEIETLTSQPVRCTYERAYDMYGAHCAGLKLAKIPSLRGGIEILDFSDNKLRKIESDTFSSYGSIKYLYLADNKIFKIDNDAFSALTSLETLDLSRNAISELTPTLFQIPTLRKLYLAANPLVHMTSNLAGLSKPIRAPLELLDLAECELQEVPDLGILPNLVVYNVSFNPLMSMDTRMFAKACNLKRVDITKSIDNVPLCELKPTILWLDSNGISFVLDDYSRLNTKEFDDCLSEDITPALNATRRLCKTEALQIQNVKTSRRTWLTISGGLFGFLVGFMLLLFVMHRHNVAQTKKATNPPPVHDSDKNAKAVLLTNVS